MSMAIVCRGLDRFWKDEEDEGPVHEILIILIILKEIVLAFSLKGYNFGRNRSHLVLGSHFEAMFGV